MRRLLLCLCLAIFPAGSSLAGPVFTTTLSPGLEVPSVASPASGSATIEFSDALDSLDFTLIMNSINTPLLQAHIHLAPPGANGPVALLLFDLCDLLAGCGPGDLRIFGSVVLAGTATAADPGVFGDILAAIAENRAYVNVHTEQFRGGELRGNLIPEPGTLFLLGAGLCGLTVLGRRSAA